MDRFTENTKLLNYNHKLIRELNSQKQWSQLDEYDKISEIYNYVKNEILFGYTDSDNIKASDVLQQEFGNGTTKSILLMALLRSNGIPCRFKGMKIKKEIHKGAITGMGYSILPTNINHGWTEIFFNEKWIVLEGVTIDDGYLNTILSLFKNIKRNLNGYAIAIIDRSELNTSWNGKNTYVQRGGIVKYLEVFNSPDDFFKYYKSNLTGLKHFIFKNFLMKKINRNVIKIRGGSLKLNA
ncbi:MAG: transglutaminase-like domain-containing protein [Candidatus Marinimicrobia bacterium]|nr:transglutaminase-like domain-containing protein [Candidatus Neomarinimicrobiota bacterium]